MESWGEQILTLSRAGKLFKHKFGPITGIAQSRQNVKLKCSIKHASNDAEMKSYLHLLSHPTKLDWSIRLELIVANGVIRHRAACTGPDWHPRIA